MSVKLVVFDIAGTTVFDNSGVATAFRNAFKQYGFTIEKKDIQPLMGYKKPVAIRSMLEKLGADFNEELVNEIHNEFQTEMLDHYEYSAEIKAMPGAEGVMLELKEKGLKIALNTGFSRVIADKIVNRMQWMEKGLIDDYIASDEVPEGRPQPFMIQALMERAGISDPGEVIKIGDTKVDVNEGFNAGCSLVIAVTTGAFTKEQLEPYAPDHIINSLEELPALIFNRE
jgi:phosphonatase-like hydrolase